MRVALGRIEAAICLLPRFKSRHVNPLKKGRRACASKNGPAVLCDSMV
jgi:hypothetical protein